MNVIKDEEYKEEDLNGFNLVQLKQICQKHGVPQKGNKKMIVKRFFNWLSSEQ